MPEYPYRVPPDPDLAHLRARWDRERTFHDDLALTLEPAELRVPEPVIYDTAVLQAAGIGAKSRVLDRPPARGASWAGATGAVRGGADRADPAAVPELRRGGWPLDRCVRTAVTNARGAGLVVYRDTGGVDAISEHSRRLVAALEGAGCPARYIGNGAAAARRRAVDPPWIILQYNPFSYGRWGVAPGLIRDALLLRQRTDSVFAVLVHEPWADACDWRSALMSAYQRVQLRLLLLKADIVMATTEGRALMLRKDALHVPVGSNITPVATTTAAARDRLGFRQDFVVALFGGRHPSRALDHAEAAINTLAARGVGSVRVLNLGRGAPQLHLDAGVEVETPGQLDPEELSWRLWASDLLLLPFTDGLSTRRTTMMAGFAHGVPIVGTRGVNTDDMINRHSEAVALAPTGQQAAFARLAADLAAEPRRLRAMGEAGRRLYRSNFDWPVLAQRVASALVGPPQDHERVR